MIGYHASDVKTEKEGARQTIERTLPIILQWVVAVMVQLLWDDEFQGRETAASSRSSTSRWSRRPWPVSTRERLHEPVEPRGAASPRSVGKMSKFGPLPVKFTLEGDYMVVNPDDFGQRYGVRFQMIPVLPALFKGTLF